MSGTGEEMASSLPIPDALLAEVFLRLPTPADLVRASAACVSFGRVAADRFFVRQFRKLHAPPLLGFLDPYGNMINPDETRFSHPAVAPYPSASAANAFALAADFSFSFLPGPSLFWAIKDIHDGRVLLDKSYREATRAFKEIAVCDPLHRRYLLLPPVPRTSPKLWRKRQQQRFIEAFLVPSAADDDEEETSFRVIWMAHCKDKVFSFVFSSVTGQWRAGPSLSCSDLFAGLVTPTSMRLFSQREYACGCFYWLADSTTKMLVLDTRRMEFSIVEAPPGAKYHNTAMVEAGGGNPGMFVLDREAFKLSYSVRRNNGGSSIQWQSEKTISLGSRYGIMGSTERYLLLYQYRSSTLEPGCFTLDVETFQLEKVCNAAKYEHGIPDLRAYVNYPPSVLSPPTVSSGLEDEAEKTLEQGCTNVESEV